MSIEDRREVIDSGVHRTRTGLVVTAAAYLVNAAVGTGIAIRRDIPGRPLGFETGLPVALDFTIGLGSGLSAPLIMLIALASFTAVAARRGGRRSIVWIGILGWCFLFGMLIEPILREVMRGQHGGLVLGIVLLNVVLPVLMIGLSIGTIRRMSRDQVPDVAEN